MSREALLDVVTPPERRERYVREGLWDDRTIAARVAAHACGRGSDIAVVDCVGSRRVSYERLEADSNRVANMLVDLGLEPGEVVAIQLPSWYEAIAIGLGASKAGAVVNPMLPIYRARELGHMLGLAETRFLFTPIVYRGFDHRSAVAQLPPEIQARLHHVPVPDPNGGGPGFLDSLAGGSVTAPNRQRPSSEVAELFFTSGTEAQPKAIMHTEQTTNFSVRVPRVLGLGPTTTWCGCRRRSATPPGSTTACGFAPVPRPAARAAGPVGRRARGRR